MRELDEQQLEFKTDVVDALLSLENNLDRVLRHWNEMLAVCTDLQLENANRPISEDNHYIERQSADKTVSISKTRLIVAHRRSVRRS